MYVGCRIHPIVQTPSLLLVELCHPENEEVYLFNTRDESIFSSLKIALLLRALLSSKASVHVSYFVCCLELLRFQHSFPSPLVHISHVQVILYQKA